MKRIGNFMRSVDNADEMAYRIEAALDKCESSIKRIVGDEDVPELTLHCYDGSVYLVQVKKIR